MQLHMCPKEFCPPFSDFHVSWKNAQLRCFLALNTFMTQEWRTSEFRNAFLRALPGFSVFFLMVLDPPGKVLISHNIETFVCDGSDNGVA